MHPSRFGPYPPIPGRCAMTGAATVPWLRIIDSAGRERLRCGHLEVVLAPSDRPPFAVAGRVVEEDTWLILSAAVEVHEPPDHPLRLLTELLELRPAPPGSVVVRETSPLQLLAVVHDLDRAPSCRQAWVAGALSAAIAEAVARGLTSLELPLLGHGHGVLSAAESAAVLAPALAAAPHGGLRRIWLVVPDEQREEVLAVLPGAAARVREGDGERRVLS